MILRSSGFIFSVFASYFPKDKQSQAIAFAETGSVLGMLILSPLLDLLVRSLGWRKALWVFSAILFVLMLPAPLLFTNRRKQMEKEQLRRNKQEEGLQLLGVDADSKGAEGGESSRNGEGQHEDDTRGMRLSGVGQTSEVEQSSLTSPVFTGRWSDSLKPYKKLVYKKGYMLFVVTTALFYYGFTSPAVFMVRPK